MQLNESIFREYDIRGIVIEDFPNEVVELEKHLVHIF